MPVVSEDSIFASEKLINNEKIKIMATTWNLDKTHSEINFKVRHMMISNVKGRFDDFDATMTTDDENFKNVRVEAIVRVDSINTNNADRDNHLKNADFFNSADYPTILFKTNTFNGSVTGDLTIHGVTKPIDLEVEFGGINTDPWGNTKAGFTFDGKIKRSEFGMTWNAALEAGGMMVSDDVKISGELQFVKA